MENPATWGMLEHEIEYVLTNYSKGLKDGVVGNTLIMELANYIKERDKRFLQFLTMPNNYIGDSVPAILLLDKDGARILSLWHRYQNPAEVF